jgi:uncharacterized damage-inducible protein DinB
MTNRHLLTGVVHPKAGANMNIQQKTQIAMLEDLLVQAFKRQTWHGPNLKGSLRGISAARAAVKPEGASHTIWEIAVHCAYWKYAVWRRLTGAKMGSFPLEGSDWFEMPEGRSESSWKSALKLLTGYHTKLTKAVSDYDPKKSPMSFEKAVKHIAGIANHDIYHAGQIQLIKRQLGYRKKR